jgi:hypothetical protein
VDAVAISGAPNNDALGGDGVVQIHYTPAVKSPEAGEENETRLIYDEGLFNDRL